VLVAVGSTGEGVRVGVSGVGVKVACCSVGVLVGVNAGMIGVIRLMEGVGTSVGNAQPAKSEAAIRSRKTTL
jgi:hypothetical protein